MPPKSAPKNVKATKLNAEPSTEATAKKVKPEKSEKAKAESIRFNAAVEACTKAGYVGGIEDFNNRGFQEKCGVLNFYILESIDRIQKSECKEADDDKFPANKYYLLTDKAKSSHSNKSVKKTTDGSVKKRQPKKKRADNELVTPTMDEDEVDESSNTSAVAAFEPEQSEETESKEKPTKKNHVTQISKTGKTWLAFIVERYVFEIYSTVYDKKIKSMNREEFVKFVLAKSKSFDSNISHSILASVDRLEASVSNISDHGFSKYLTEKIEPLFTLEENRGYMVRHIVDYLISYFKLLGYTIARMLWSNRRTTDSKVIEAAVRILDMNNEEYLVSQHFVASDAPSRGLSNGGVYRDGRKYNDALNPPISDEEKKSRNDKRNASKKAKESVTETSTDTVTETTAKKLTKKLTKKTQEVEAEIEYEEEEEVEEEVDEEEEVDVPEEEEEVEVKPTKPVRKLVVADPPKKNK